MKLLVDAQLPHRLVQGLITDGHDAIHTTDLQLGNRTPDEDIAAIAAKEGRIVVTKDSDFVTTFWLNRKPPNLLLISTGNITNVALLQIIAANLGTLESAFSHHDFEELSPTTLIIHI